jgi:hypothetical protein
MEGLKKPIEDPTMRPPTPHSADQMYHACCGGRRLEQQGFKVISEYLNEGVTSLRVVTRHRVCTICCLTKCACMVAPAPRPPTITGNFEDCGETPKGPLSLAR